MLTMRAYAVMEIQSIVQTFVFGTMLANNGRGTVIAQNLDLEILNSDLKEQLEKANKDLLETQKQLTDLKDRGKYLESRYQEDCVRINQLRVTVNTLACMYANLQETAGLL
nr:MAG TPA: hypothetical protein [Caudoviricetes sp.]